eukprot:CAMPEP_0171461214 /NCGR_PEP_ID=MMETSP0945-20130129/5756_1 /TAXON_ID=109269 /ORGANISM="Vaucheria litorea, Strain CCMP2940" /LENGTH=104 /DNA_ID=CAMNT_0011987525 /DNA_START=49 /DNA_END=363 /DNA_ORIENTATION=+
MDGDMYLSIIRASTPYFFNTDFRSLLSICTSGFVVSVLKPQNEHKLMATAMIPITGYAPGSLVHTLMVSFICSLDGPDAFLLMKAHVLGTLRKVDDAVLIENID